MKLVEISHSFLQDQWNEQTNFSEVNETCPSKAACRGDRPLKDAKGKAIARSSVGLGQLFSLNSVYVKKVKSGKNIYILKNNKKKKVKKKRNPGAEHRPSTSTVCPGRAVTGAGWKQSSEPPAGGTLPVPTAFKGSAASPGTPPVPRPRAQNLPRLPNRGSSPRAPTEAFRNLSRPRRLGSKRGGEGRERLQGARRSSARI